MQTLNQFDVLFARNRLPRDLRDILVEFGAEDRPGRSFAPAKAFLAGGFIRSIIAREKVNDIDLFACSKDVAEQLADKIAAKFGVHSYSSDNAYTMRAKPYTIQVIYRWTFEDPEKCVESFDYTIARAAIWATKHFHQGERRLDGTFVESLTHNTWASSCDDDYYADLAARRLVYRKPVREEAAGGSLLRLLKFYRRGYTAPLDTLASVMARMSVKVRSDTRGVEGETEEERHARVLLGLLHEVDPNSVTNDPVYIDTKEEAA